MHLLHLLSATDKSIDHYYTLVLNDKYLKDMHCTLDMLLIDEQTENTSYSDWKPAVLHRKKPVADDEN